MVVLRVFLDFSVRWNMFWCVVLLLWVAVWLCVLLFVVDVFRVAGFVGWLWC